MAVGKLRSVWDCSSAALVLVLFSVCCSKPEEREPSGTRVQEAAGSGTIAAVPPRAASVEQPHSTPVAVARATPESAAQQVVPRVVTQGTSAASAAVKVPPATVPWSALSLPGPAKASKLASLPRSGLVLSVPWGSGPGQVGYSADGGGVGPLGFTVSSDSRWIFILDQENQRILKFEGARFVTALPIGTLKARYIETWGAEHIVLGEPYEQPGLTLFTLDGTREQRVPLPTGPNALLAGMLPSAVGLWSALGGDTHTQVLDAQAHSVARKGSTFWPSQTGRSWLHYRLRGADVEIEALHSDGKRSSPPASAPDLRLRVSTGMHVDVADLRTDGKERLYLFTDHGRGYSHWLHVLSRRGGLLHAVELPNKNNCRGDCTKRQHVTPNGDVFYFQPSGKAARVYRVYP